MWLFWVFEFLVFIAVLSLIFIYCRFRKQGFWSFIWKYLKWVVLAIVVVWLAIAVLCYQHLYNAAHCYFRGVSMHSNTKYSIVFNECQVETRGGNYLPIDRARALPGSKDSDSDIDDTKDTNESLSE